VAQASRLRVHRASRPVIRALKIAQDRTQEEEERQARLAANQAALTRITQIAKSRHVNEGVSTACALNMKIACNNWPSSRPKMAIQNSVCSRPITRNCRAKRF